MESSEPEDGTTWRARSALADMRSVIDPRDHRGRKNAIIDRIQKSALIDELNLADEKSILDYGCGDGRIATWLEQLGTSVIGVDTDGSMIERARNRTARVRFEVLTTEQLPFEADYFDATVTVTVLQYLVSKPELMRRTCHEIHRVLKPGARLLCVEQIMNSDIGRGGSLETYCDLSRGLFELKKVAPLRHGLSKLWPLVQRLPMSHRLKFIDQISRFDAAKKLQHSLNGSDYVEVLLVFQAVA